MGRVAGPHGGHGGCGGDTSRHPRDGVDAVLYVGSGPDEVAPYFADVRKVADGGADASVWLCTGRREPWASFWPQLRHLTVS